MIPDLIKEILFNSIAKVLPWLQKKIYPLRQFEKDVEIDTRRENPLSFNITGESPYWNLYLDIENKSQYLSFVFDRAIISVNTDSPYYEIIKNVAIINKMEVEKKNKKQLFCKLDLTEYQVKLLNKIKDKNDLRATINIIYYGESKLYNLEKKIQLPITHYVIQ